MSPLQVEYKKSNLHGQRYPFTYVVSVCVLHLCSLKRPFDNVIIFGFKHQKGNGLLFYTDVDPFCLSSLLVSVLPVSFPSTRELPLATQQSGSVGNKFFTWASPTASLFLKDIFCVYRAVGQQVFSFSTLNVIPLTSDFCGFHCRIHSNLNPSFRIRKA